MRYGGAMNTNARPTEAHTTDTTPTHDDLATAVREALLAAHQAGYHQAAFIHGTSYDRTHYAQAQAESDAATTKVWALFYEVAAR